MTVCQIGARKTRPSCPRLSADVQPASRTLSAIVGCGGPPTFERRLTRFAPRARDEQEIAGSNAQKRRHYAARLSSTTGRWRRLPM